MNKQHGIAHNDRLMPLALGPGLDMNISAPARQATFSGPKGISVANNGSIYVADTENHAIRRIDQKNELITTVAGTGERGDGLDGDPRNCKLSRPHGIFVSDTGTIFIGDTENHKVRRIP